MDDQQDNGPNSAYSMPKIIDYLQYEWFRYEVDRSHWVSEKADLISRITQLEAERNTQETIKNDLFKRVKMLEYALSQERAKNTGEAVVPPPKDSSEEQQSQHRKKPSKASITRSLIKKYLKDMNYNDILVSKPDLTIEQYEPNGEAHMDTEDVPTMLNLTDMKQQQQLKQHLQQQKRQQQQQNEAAQQTEPVPTFGSNDNNNNATELPNLNTGDYSLSDLTNSLDALSSDMASLDSMSNGGSFDFSSIEGLQQNLDDLQLPKSEEGSDMFSSVINMPQHQAAADGNNGMESSSINTVNHKPTGSMDGGNEPSFDSWNEDFFNKLSHNSKGRMKLKGLSMGDGAAGKSKKGAVEKSVTPTGSMGRKKGLAADLMGIGVAELNDIKLEDNSKLQNDSAPRQWRFKHTLKSHFDGVRSLQFHPTEPLLVSASEDNTLKIWNLNHLSVATTKKAGSMPDVEPLHTFRGHTGPVFTTVLSENGSHLYSAGFDGVIKRWTMPSGDADLYHRYGRLENYLDREFDGHADGIWDLQLVGRSNLASASSDGTVCIWDVNSGALCSKLTHPNGLSVAPTSMSLPATESAQRLLVAYNDGSVLLYDIESGRVVSELRPSNEAQVNKVVTHNLMPLAITGSEDHKIEFWDLVSNQTVHSMVAHSDAITSLTIDPSGLYVASCSHDSTIRFWDISSKTCAQDLISHRPKYNESIHTIKYHPTKGYFASGGADAVIRIHQ
ncbi:hypothetical protein SAMD00019534_016940 [Acytostelium subglobosum LB1]|uniref:hypothetical protein n=1 Tax=Acytostelium subglobosum LB1 TaxID=1410327 RepID=UPI0006448102|nr:hypothetical protein SAMD00019534_016940 [Acytostelium subglobosum LB1]GAM18519.1 hypothetical protein SAMD00019534_016940 [Acytostelium subglobosum LB1]|eukprot:XP_012757739.1 hypothetical protein SAMD00019534_016940 [Acytostelium subglobosum LB1]